VALVVVVTVATATDVGETLEGLAGRMGQHRLYLLPTIIGIARKHLQLAPIMIINFLLGWTVIGWIGALVWSVASFRHERTAPSSSGPIAP
jgi:hypothetical protein